MSGLSGARCRFFACLMCSLWFIVVEEKAREVLLLAVC